MSRCHHHFIALICGGGKWPAARTALASSMLALRPPSTASLAITSSRPAAAAVARALAHNRVRKKLYASCQCCRCAAA
eukprot:scaffold19270_cov66-Phaeocystis_antarctica.AAC.2